MENCSELLTHSITEGEFSWGDPLPTTPRWYWITFGVRSFSNKQLCVRRFETFQDSLKWAKDILYGENDWWKWFTIELVHREQEPTGNSPAEVRLTKSMLWQEDDSGHIGICAANFYRVYSNIPVQLGDGFATRDEAIEYGRRQMAGNAEARGFIVEELDFDYLERGKARWGNIVHAELADRRTICPYSEASYVLSGRFRYSHQAYCGDGIKLGTASGLESEAIESARQAMAAVDAPGFWVVRTDELTNRVSHIEQRDGAILKEGSPEAEAMLPPSLRIQKEADGPF